MTYCHNCPCDGCREETRRREQAAEQTAQTWDGLLNGQYLCLVTGTEFTVVACPQDMHQRWVLGDDGSSRFLSNCVVRVATGPQGTWRKVE